MNYTLGIEVMARKLARNAYEDQHQTPWADAPLAERDRWIAAFTTAILRVSVVKEGA